MPIIKVLRQVQFADELVSTVAVDVVVTQRVVAVTGVRHSLSVSDLDGKQVVIIVVEHGTEWCLSGRMFFGPALYAHGFLSPIMLRFVLDGAAVGAVPRRHLFSFFLAYSGASGCPIAAR